MKASCFIAVNIMSFISLAPTIKVIYELASRKLHLIHEGNQLNIVLTSIYISEKFIDAFFALVQEIHYFLHLLQDMMVLRSHLDSSRKVIYYLWIQSTKAHWQHKIFHKCVKYCLIYNKQVYFFFGIGNEFLEEDIR